MVIIDEEGKKVFVVDENRITGWLLRSEIPWLQSEKERIEKQSSKKCIIIGKFNKQPAEFALFYNDGHFDEDGEWIECQVSAVELKSA